MMILYSPLWIIMFYRFWSYPTFSIPKIREFVINIFPDTAKSLQSHKNNLWIRVNERTFEVDRALQVRERYDGRTIQTEGARKIEHKIIKSIPNFKYL